MQNVSLDETHQIVFPFLMCTFPAGSSLAIGCICTTPKKLFTLLDLCVSSLRRGHANLLCIVPILTDDLRRGSNYQILVWRLHRS